MTQQQYIINQNLNDVEFAIKLGNLSESRRRGGARTQIIKTLTMQIEVRHMHWLHQTYPPIK